MKQFTSCDLEYRINETIILVQTQLHIYFVCENCGNVSCLTVILCVSDSSKLSAKMERRAAMVSR